MKNSPPFPTPKSGSKHRKGDADSVERQKLNLLQQVTSVLATPDPSSFFGHQVAVELKLIKNISIQTRAKKKIMNILFEAQEADQSTPSPSSHIPPATHSPLTPTQMLSSIPSYTQPQHQHYHQLLPPQGPAQPQNYFRMLEDMDE